MTQQITKRIDEDSEILEYYEIFKDYVVNRKTYKDIAKEMGIDPKRVSALIARARSEVATDLRKYSQKYVSDLFIYYKKIYEEAIIEWEATRDAKYLDLARKAVKDIGILLGVNAPPKAAVSSNEDDDSIPQIVFSDLNVEEYREKEKTFREMMETAEIIDLNAINNEEKDDDV